MLEKGYVLGNNTMSKAKSFDEKHQLTANASQIAANAQAKVVSIDNKIGITQKLNAGAATINQQVKAVDEKYHVSEKTRSAVQVAEQKLNAAGTAIAKNRYVLTGTSWVVGAYAKVAKTAEEVGQKTLEKVATLSSGDQKSPRSSSTSEGFAPPPPYPADDPAVGSRPASAPTPAESNDQSQSKPAATL
jgi:septation ring formation regulator EzrA